MQIQKTETFGFRPVYTEDGVDYLYTELDMAVTAIVNPMALATNGAGKIAVRAGGNFLEDAPAQAGGDPLGISLKNLRAMLLTPRQTLSFSIVAPNGQSNSVFSITGPDSNNGPLPQRDTYVRWILGTNTALVYFHVKAWAPDLLPTVNGISTLPRVVLANRYRVTSTTDENWYSRRHIAGQMIVDIGQLQTLSADGVLTPDNFRQAAFLQIPLGFKRENVQVTVSSDNTTLDYSYVDQETPLAMGLKSLATDIEGMASVGVQSPLARLTGITSLVAAAANGADRALRAVTTPQADDPWWKSFGRGFVGGLTSPNLVPGDMTGAGAGDLIAAAAVGLPKITAHGLVRVTGQRYASKLDLAKLGVNILLDRFAGEFFNAYFSPGNTARIGTITVNQNLKDRVVEVSMSFIATYWAEIQALVNAGGLAPFTVNLMNMSSDIKINDGNIGQIAQNSGAATTLVGSAPAINVAPPNSGSTRGNWLGALVVSLLSSPGTLPVNAPADPAINVDLASFI